MKILYSANEFLPEHELPFDPTYGYHEKELLALTHPEAPSDFAAFWQETYAEVQEQAVHFEREDVNRGGDHWDVFQVFYRAWDDVLSGFANRLQYTEGVGR